MTATDPVRVATRRGLKRTYDMFASEDLSLAAESEDAASQRSKLLAKIASEYHHVRSDTAVNATALARSGVGAQKQQDNTNPRAHLSIPTGREGMDGGKNATTASQQHKALDKVPFTKAPPKKRALDSDLLQQTATSSLLESIDQERATEQSGDQHTSTSTALMAHTGANAEQGDKKSVVGTGTLARFREAPKVPDPEWHAPWKLFRVVSGHTGWVRCITVDPGNKWFATGSVDRLIKIWDLATGKLKLSLTGHISDVRGLAVSDRSPYLFSAAQDNKVLCWDLEYNKIVRSYHGHLSGVYCCTLHPTQDLLCTGGRDAVCRVWDIRTKAPVHVLSGHANTVGAIMCQAGDPQVVTSSMDATIKMYDLVAGKCRTTLTHHKKSVRCMVKHHSEWTFASGSPDSIRQWKFPNGDFIQSLKTGEEKITALQQSLHTLSLNQDNVMFSAGDGGRLRFWDWKSGHCFQTMETKVQPGTMDSENNIYASAFDKSGSRLITCEGDKTIKFYKEDDTATPETHPLDWKPDLMRRKF